MCNIIRSLGLELRAVIKSVKVRWNSVLAEIRMLTLTVQHYKHPNYYY
jgi:hypothetical protein